MFQICRRSLDKFILCTAVIHEIHTKKNAPECDFCQYQILSKTQDESVETILVSGTDDNTEPHEVNWSLLMLQKSPLSHEILDNVEQFPDNNNINR